MYFPTGFDVKIVMIHYLETKIVSERTFDIRTRFTANHNPMMVLPKCLRKLLQNFFSQYGTLTTLTKHCMALFIKGRLLETYLILKLCDSF